MPKSKIILEIEAWCIERRGQFTLKQLQSIIEKHYKLEYPMLISLKTRNYSDARKTYCWFALRLTHAHASNVGSQIRITRPAVFKQDLAANDLMDANYEPFVEVIEKIYNELKLI